MKASNLIPAKREPFNPDFANAARIACAELGETSPEAFARAYAAYSQTFQATEVCPASEAFHAAKLAAMGTCLLYCIDRDGAQITKAQRLPLADAERLQIARNRAEMSVPVRSVFRVLNHCDTGNRWVTEKRLP